MERGSGPEVARLFHRLLATQLVIAWLSLGWQVRLLIGAKGLLPLAPFLDAARREHVGFGDFPTIFWWNAADGVLVAGVALGVALAVAQLFLVRPRACAALSCLLYLSYATAGRTFLSFQWDNLLLEACLLAAFLPIDRRTPWVHLLFRLLVFKLYFESGIAKWQSPIADWQDGSAMTFYYETAPLPTWVAWWMHQLPASWHHLESWGTLALELGASWAIFGPRPARLAAFVVFSGFQVIDIATANYGFFCTLSLCLHVFLLDDADVARMGTKLRAWLRRPPGAAPPISESPSRLAHVRLGGEVVLLCAWAALSLANGALAFSRSERLQEDLVPWVEPFEPFRLVNTYHLFAAITQERIEPELQTFDGRRWTARHFWHKPGDPMRAPDFVAPHQPRVDFQLWFYGLSNRRTPPWVRALVERVCVDPAVVQPLFRTRLPARPEAVRLVYWRYHFTTRADRRRTGAWWTRVEERRTDAIGCR